MQVRSEETHNKILNHAVKLFAGKGYEATGVAEICDAASVSKGALYHHFPSKQAIFIELLKTWLRELDVQLGTAISGSVSVPEALLAMVGQIKDVFNAADEQAHLFLEFWQQARREPEVWKEFIAPYRRYQEYFARLVEKGIAEGSIRPQDSMVAGQTIVGLAIGMIVQGIFDPGAAHWDRVTHDAIQILITGLSTGRPEPDPRGGIL
jgi:AcrR family transcriptional regulator